MTGLKVLQEPKKKSRIGQIWAIAAGKGGVGKSTVSVQLALALKEQGYKVGLLDADIYGPSLEQMLPEGMEPIEDLEDPEKLLPGLALGIPFVSVAHFKKKASIVRAPIANQIIEQFLTIVEWGELDYLLIDFPPGTGDIQLTLMQKAQISAAIMVTTPQVVATLDVSKAIQLFQKMEIPVLGVLENMSFFEQEGKKVFPFGQGGAKILSTEFSIPILGEIPLDPEVSESGDKGVALRSDASSAKAFKETLITILDLEKKLSNEVIEVRELDPQNIEIQFDRTWHTLSLHQIQKQCRCAACERGKKSDPSVSLLEFSPVGRYAIRFKFSSGCSQGIYPFTLLKNLV
ncbi:MAG: P-loop NTPase [Simkaniaceae bacterium]|nr:P-loop NTPase [Candidatus Sacchlamyda saccharinae]